MWQRSPGWNGRAHPERERRMSGVRRVYVEKKEPFAVAARQLKEDIEGFLGIEKIRGVRILIRYDVENISDDTFEKGCRTVFSEPPVDDLYKENIEIPRGISIFSLYKSSTGGSENTVRHPFSKVSSEMFSTSYRIRMRTPLIFSIPKKPSMSSFSCLAATANGSFFSTYTRLTPLILLSLSGCALPFQPGERCHIKRYWFHSILKKWMDVPKKRTSCTTHFRHIIA